MYSFYRKPISENSNIVQYCNLAYKQKTPPFQPGFLLISYHLYLISIYYAL